MTISLIHPSRGRAVKSIQNSNDWLLMGRVQTEIIVSIDSDDKERHKYKQFYPSKCVMVNDNKSVVEATNNAAKEAKGDILIYLSDDFTCFDGWGLAVIEEFKKYTGPTLIKVDDCLQPFQIKVLTIPMMNRELYNKLGYFWHPDYRSMHVDEDLFWTSQKLGALKFAPHLKFPHIHPANPNPSMRCDNDDTYRRSAANWEQGKAVFAKRKATGFPL